MKRLRRAVCFSFLGLGGCTGPPSLDQTPPPNDGGGQDPCGGITQGGPGGVGAQCSAGFICAPQVIFECAPGLRCCITNPDKPGFCVDPTTDGGAPHCFQG